MATCYSVLGLEFAGELAELSDAQETAIITFLMKGARADGCFHDPLFHPRDILNEEHDVAYFQEETTTFCQQALDALLAPPPPPRDWPTDQHTAAGLTRHLESFPWKYPCVASSRVMFVLSQLSHDAERHQKQELLSLIDTALDWLDGHQRADTGLWEGLHRNSLADAIAATFQFTFYYSYRRRPLRYVERIVDSCLALQEPHGLFSDAAIGHTWLDYGALDLLAKATLATDYRSRDVEVAMSRTYDALQSLHNTEDGGFAHCKERLGSGGDRKPRRLTKLRLSNFVPLRARVAAKGGYDNYWRMLSSPTAESNAFSTWLRLLALRLSTQRQWLDSRSDEGVTFRRLPFLGNHNPLAVQSSYGVSSTAPLAKDAAWQRTPNKAVHAHQPLISVIIPAYNAARFLPATLASLRAQIYPRWEGIIVNDGSTDETGDIARRWVRSDARFRVIEQENKGLAAARNVALRSAKGEWIHCLDADDLIEPEFYAEVVSRIDPANASEVCCYVCQYWFFQGNGRIISTIRVKSEEVFSLNGFSQSNAGPPHCHIFPSSLLHSSGLFDDELRVVEDWDLWIRFSRLGVRFKLILKPLAWYRAATGSLSRNYIKMVTTGAEILQRVTESDDRLVLRHGTAESMGDPAIVQKGIVRLWWVSLQRALAEKNLSQARELFQWGRTNLPGDLWTSPANYGIDFRFQWFDYRPPKEALMVESVQRCCDFMRLLRERWPEHDSELAASHVLRWLSQMLVEAKQISKYTPWYKLRLVPSLFSTRIVKELGIVRTLRLLKRALVSKR
jgi:glycosyltransferase involved in cell wall biosynthesis